MSSLTQTKLPVPIFSWYRSEFGPAGFWFVQPPKRNAFVPTTLNECPLRLDGMSPSWGGDCHSRSVTSPIGM